MNFRAVTTCHAKGWRDYGRRMAKTFLMYWRGVPLTLYAEGFNPDNALLRDVRPLPQWQVDFKKRHAGDPAMNGKATQRYDLIHDAVRFSHKVGAVTDAIEKADSDDGVLIWIDADVMTHAPVTLDFLTKLVPDWGNTAVAWLNRDKKYPECGFVMFNLAHPATPSLIATWRALYTEDRLFHLDGWTDCHALQFAVQECAAPTASLSGAHSNLGHPFINGPLGAVMDHLKGDRKAYGRSHRADLRLRRNESYWRGGR